jgi:hypothetical protein
VSRPWGEPGQANSTWTQTPFAQTTVENRWLSHVRNFVEDYKSKYKKHFHGPSGFRYGANQLWGANGVAITQEVKNWICHEFCDGFSSECPEDQPNIDIIGHSRGGVIAVDVAWLLKTQGCKCNYHWFPKLYQPVTVRFLGLYDPVDMGVNIGNREDIEGYKPGVIPSNVSYSSRVIAESFSPLMDHFYGSQSLSRPLWFRPAYANATWTHPIAGTHSALGGAPTFDVEQSYIDHGYSHGRDIDAAILADNLIRSDARRVGVPINFFFDNVRYDYDNMPPLKPRDGPVLGGK